MGTTVTRRSLFFEAGRSASYARLGLLLLAIGTGATGAAPAVRATAPSPAAPVADTPRDIEVVARRFRFEPAEIEVGLDEPVRLLVRSADGPHGVEIKKFNVRKDVPRGGQVVEIPFTASETGRFPILCSEYCGDGHDDMTGTLVVIARTPTGEVR